ncbi:hypothetical protein TBR22_A01280 [Luteitalea sp. TBR-22]|uniref:dienelactone hydrolase family protein n=1 Tax=Luteitalea sp. TBR-22 TaxID=2802971 RepID=UPI001AF50F4D|nr:hypothetical protein [Luteitalea sp. TBR-22]BCS30927.1 hypothetical protein TBR22_A01280 [Luteitalea sp. TBR-22]
MSHPSLYLAALVLYLAWGTTPLAPRTDAAATKGPFDVGFRVEAVRDRSRTLGPATDFEGRRHLESREWPVQVSVWYPSHRAVGPVMSDGEYRAWHGVRETLGTPGAPERGQAASDLLSLMTAADIPGGPEDARLAMDARGVAVADAPPAPGPHPLVVGGLGSAGIAWPLAERLASHGYVVATAATLGRTASDEATRPQVALETRARTLEFVIAHVLSTREVDAERIGLVGVNFDGAAALLSQSRMMRARAVVSIDGREGKPGGGDLLDKATGFDVVRLRVPYMTVQWDEPTLPALDAALFERMVYAPRDWLIFRGLRHAHLVGNVASVPTLPGAQRQAIGRMHALVQSFLDTHVRGIVASPPPIEPALLAATRHLDALPAAPTREELEELLWNTGDVLRGLEIVRQAQARQPGLVLLDAATARLYAFRHEAAGRPDKAAPLRRYAEETAEAR